jgi:hypothetical protein
MIMPTMAITDMTARTMRNIFMDLFMDDGMAVTLRIAVSSNCTAKVRKKPQPQGHGLI